MSLISKYQSSYKPEAKFCSFPLSFQNYARTILNCPHLHPPFVIHYHPVTSHTTVNTLQNNPTRLESIYCTMNYTKFLCSLFSLFVAGQCMNDISFFFSFVGIYTT